MKQFTRISRFRTHNIASDAICALRSFSPNSTSTSLQPRLFYNSSFPEKNNRLSMELLSWPIDNIDWYEKKYKTIKDAKKQTSAAKQTWEILRY